MKILINISTLIGIGLLFIYSNTIHEMLLTLIAFMLWCLLTFGKNNKK